MKSPRRHRRAKRSRWAHVNTPEGLRRRTARADAKREAIAATLPPVPDEPAPLSVWQTVLVLDATGEIMNRIVLYVPVEGHRCDQFAAEVYGERRLLTPTEVGKLVAPMIHKRPSQAMLAEARRDEWLAAAASLAISPVTIG